MILGREPSPQEARAMASGLVPVCSVGDEVLNQKSVRCKVTAIVLFAYLSGGHPTLRWGYRLDDELDFITRDQIAPVAKA